MEKRNVKINPNKLKSRLKEGLSKNRQGQHQLQEQIAHAMQQSSQTSDNKPQLTIQIGKCIEGMQLVIPTHYSLAERERLETEYLKFHRHLLEEKIRWISSIRELIPSVFDGDNNLEIQCH